MEWLKKTKKPSYKKEYQIYHITLFSLNLVLAIVNASLFFLKYGKEINIGYLFGFVLIFLLLNFYYGLQQQKKKQILIFVNLLFFQYLIYNLVEKEIWIIIPKVLFFKFLKEDLLIPFFIFDMLILIIFYYLNVIYPEHRYEKKF
ncbi:MAG: hypothetical protein QXV64_02805 [Candidatus Anstonellaceae archaeon]